MLSPHPVASSALLFCLTGYSLLALWNSLNEHYLFFAQELPEVVFSFFFPLLANIAARAWPSPGLSEDLQHALGLAAGRGCESGLLKNNTTREQRRKAEAGSRALEGAAWMNDDAFLPYPLLSSGDASRRAKTSPPPGVADLAVLQLVFLLCPLTDYRHPLVSPALLLLDFFASKLSAFPLFLTDNPTRPPRLGVDTSPAEASSLHVPELALGLDEEGAYREPPEGHSGSGEEHARLTDDGSQGNVLQQHRGPLQGKEGREAVGGSSAVEGSAKEAQVGRSSLPPILPLSRVALALQVLSLQRQVQTASSRYMPSFFSLSVALLRTAIENLQESGRPASQAGRGKPAAEARPSGASTAAEAGKADAEQALCAGKEELVRVAEAVIATLHAQASQLVRCHLSRPAISCHLP